MTTLLHFLEQNGPARSSVISEWLVNKEGLTSEAARKRLSANRLKAPVRAFPIPLLPKKESFLYLQSQRSEERFWTNFLIAMRQTNSVFGMAIDGLTARHGLISEIEFPVISGAPATGLKGQLMASTVAQRLLDADVMTRKNIGGQSHFTWKREFFGLPDESGLRTRLLTEKVVLDGLREWVRKMGAASYNKISIRGEKERSPVGPYLFDVAGPSYLLPIRHEGRQPGFFVADVFVGTTLNEYQIQFFLRKTATLHGMLRKNGGGLFALLLADGFTPEAITTGHRAGIVLTTPGDLFGRKVGESIRNLMLTLNNVAKYAANGDVDRVVGLLDDLSDIEGSAGNQRGILFELVAAYLLRRTNQSIDLGVKATDPESGKLADIDILAFNSNAADVTAVECKGKSPDGFVTLDEVEDWLRRIPIFTEHLRAQRHLRESRLKFELWTSGTFNADALEKLEREKIHRTRNSISWMDGKAVLKLATDAKEKAIADALRTHFLRHPLARMEMQPISQATSAVSVVPTQVRSLPQPGDQQQLLTKN